MSGAFVYLLWWSYLRFPDVARVRSVRGTERWLGGPMALCGAISGDFRLNEWTDERPSNCIRRRTQERNVESSNSIGSLASLDLWWPHTVWMPTWLYTQCYCYLDNGQPDNQACRRNKTSLRVHPLHHFFSAGHITVIIWNNVIEKTTQSRRLKCARLTE